MLPTNKINQEETMLAISQRESQLQNQKQNNIEDQDNQVSSNPNCNDNIIYFNDNDIIQICKFDYEDQTIQQHSHQVETQLKEGVNVNQFENQKNDLDSASYSHLQIADEKNDYNTKRLDSQEVVQKDDIHIQIDIPQNIIKQSNSQKSISLIKFDDNSDARISARIEQKPIAHYILIPAYQRKQNFEENNPQEDLNIQQDDQNENCPICRANFEKIVKLLECEHMFCESCYKEYLEDRIKIAKINNIPCLQEGCSAIFSENIIKSLVSEQKFQQYLIFKRKYEIENDPNKKWCPAKGCDRFIEKDPRTNLIQCQCGQLICFNCGQIAHQGMLCEDAIQGDFKLALAKYLIKYCPKCKSHIQKNAGCNHMTCTNCSFQFCWVCLQPYHQYHYRYWSYRGCAIWSNGRFKTTEVIKNPDKMRKIYFVPRVLLYIFRGPLLIVKLTLKAACKSIVKPFVQLNKKMCKSQKPKLCLLKCIYFLLAELLILLIVILVFPFYFLFYQCAKEIKWISIKGCAY
ncbi:unnamed protein product [Paramecium primaurelia]|uniref:RBR-type E3 ubiquitin transferase n=1 Tax=Paramecium primaurelia TaxID=5886 RepID=A0A8S1PEV7_PARPR|nr:unnamed protein product [Paramecium primaurelia]